MLARLVLLIALAVGTGTQILAAEGQAEKVFRAGAATSNITPPLGLPIVGGWDSPPAAHIHDELHVRCLVLDDGQTKIGFAICDNVGIPREVYDEARKFIAAETDLPPENIVMAATHTHSAVAAGQRANKVRPAEELNEYQRFVARRIADGIRRALNHLEPARIGWGGIDEPSEVFNRRWHVTDSELLKNPFGKVDHVRMNPPRGSTALVRPAGPTDPEISFISVQSRDGLPIALLANYSLHYVGGVGKQEISADYFGAFANRIGELVDTRRRSPAFVGILSNGTSGDVNNINFREKAPRHEPYEKIKQVANLVANRVLEAHKSIVFHDWVPLGAASRELTLQVRKPDETMARYFENVLAKPEGETPYHAHERAYAERVGQLASGPSDVAILVQAVRIGDLAIAAIPFEVFTEIGLAIKEKSSFGDAFTIELANGSYGYLPTPAQHKLGGYETWMGTNNVQLDASDRITEVILKLMNDLKTNGE